MASKLDSEKQVVESISCLVCNKKFRSQGQYEQHINSKKHKLAVELCYPDQDIKPTEHVPSKSEEKVSENNPESQFDDMLIKEITKDKETKEDEPKEDKDESSVNESQMTDEEIYEYRRKNSKQFEINECLFCCKKSKNLDSNLSHMHKDHGLFIPDLEKIVDLEGLIKYLGEKISIGYTCIYCNGVGKSFKSLEAVQHHMIAKNHCKMLYEGNEDEYEDFYDFSSDEIEKPDLIETNIGELMVSKNKILGHRDFRIYYKQKRRIPRDITQFIEDKCKSIELKKDQLAKAYPKYIRQRQKDELRTQMATNKAGMLRFKSDNPF